MTASAIKGGDNITDQNTYISYTDENNNEFQMKIVKHLYFEEKNYVLVYESSCKHDEECRCHEHHHDQGEVEMYLFEIIVKDGHQFLFPVSDELMKTMEAIIENV